MEDIKANEEYPKKRVKLNPEIEFVTSALGTASRNNAKTSFTKILVDNIEKPMTSLSGEYFGKSQNSGNINQISDKSIQVQHEDLQKLPSSNISVRRKLQNFNNYNNHMSNNILIPVQHKDIEKLPSYKISFRHKTVANIETEVIKEWSKKVLEKENSRKIVKKECPKKRFFKWDPEVELLVSKLPAASPKNTKPSSNKILVDDIVIPVSSLTNEFFTKLPSSKISIRPKLQNSSNAKQTSNKLIQVKHEDIEKLPSSKISIRPKLQKSNNVNRMSNKLIQVKHEDIEKLASPNISSRPKTVTNIETEAIKEWSKQVLEKENSRKIVKKECPRKHFKWDPKVELLVSKLTAASPNNAKLPFNKILVDDIVIPMSSPTNECFTELPSSNISVKHNKFYILKTLNELSVVKTVKNCESINVRVCGKIKEVGCNNFYLENVDTANGSFRVLLDFNYVECYLPLNKTLQIFAEVNIVNHEPVLKVIFSKDLSELNFNLFRQVEDYVISHFIKKNYLPSLATEYVDKFKKCNKVNEMSDNSMQVLHEGTEKLPSSNMNVRQSKHFVLKTLNELSVIKAVKSCESINVRVCGKIKEVGCNNFYLENIDTANGSFRVLLDFDYVECYLPLNKTLQIFAELNIVNHEPVLKVIFSKDLSELNLNLFRQVEDYVISHFIKK